MNNTPFLAYCSTVDVPETIVVGNANAALNTGNCETKIAENTYERIRLAYNGDTTLTSFAYTYTDATGAQQTVGPLVEEVVDATTGEVTYNYLPPLNIYSSEQAWETAKDADLADGLEGKQVGDDEIIYIEETGEFIFGKNVANQISDGLALNNTPFLAYCSTDLLSHSKVVQRIE